MLEAAPPTLRSLKEPVRERLREVQDELVHMIAADFGAVDEVAEYLLQMRGKLLRPTLLLLSDQVEGGPTEEAVKVGAVVEMIHVATLVHDDAVDHSVRRRGMPTVNSRWTHQVAVIMGDYLYSRAVTEMARIGSLEAIELLAQAANRMTVGEMRQLTSHEALDFTEEEYYLLCECKTASLMETACELGALLGSPGYREPLRSYGFQVGMAFQITDDVLDYTGSLQEAGKPTGLDLREHKVTLPLIAALPRFDVGERELVERLFEDPEPDPDMVDAVIDAVELRGGLDYARARAEEYVERARGELEALPAGEAGAALERVLDYVVDRRR